MRFFIILFFNTLLISGCANKNREYVSNEGFIFGTNYKIKYENRFGDLHSEIKQLLQAINKSLSPFDTNSVISRFNKGEENVLADSFFIEVFTKATEIHKLSDGAFDITVAPLINLWGFGFEKHETINEKTVDSLMQFVGMENVYIENSFIKRKKEGIILNASAIAKGYGVDVVAKFLKNKGIDNYLIEIGGEISASGVNQKGNLWHIGIENPIKNNIVEVDNFQINSNINNHDFIFTVQLSGKALATSGNYRNFRIIDGKEHGHTIDPRTGYPVQTSILSATIIADNCITADAFATVCMVIGLEKSIELIEKIDGIEGAFIYRHDEKEEVKIAFSSGFKIFK